MFVKWKPGGHAIVVETDIVNLESEKPSKDVMQKCYGELIRR